MRNRKKHKTIDDFSVAQLLDNFVRVDTPESVRSPQKIDDEAYVRMMLKKDAVRKLERTKREARVQERKVTPSSRSDTLDEKLKQHFFPNVEERPAEKEVPPEAKERSPEKREISPEKKQEAIDNGIVEEILDSIVVKDVSGLAARMKEAVDFIQDEMGTSDTERKLVEALERYSKPTETSQKKSGPPMYNENVLVLKRCQNCHYCVGEQNRNGSVWCLCTNPDRSTEVEIDDSWVKSGINLSCWKTLQD